MRSSYMEQFILAVRAYLAQVGVISQSDSYSENITIDDCTYYVRNYRRGFKIEGIRFKASEAAKAAAHILKCLPDKLKERDRRKRQAQLYAEATAVNQILPNSINVMFNQCLNEPHGAFQLTFVHSDKSTVMTAADYLQDGGFCDEKTPKHSRIVNQLLRVWQQLSEEERAEFLSKIE